MWKIVQLDGKCVLIRDLRSMYTHVIVLYTLVNHVHV